MPDRQAEDEVMAAWDGVADAMQRVECALPAQMTTAVDVMVQRRKSFGALLQAFMRDRAATLPDQGAPDA